MEGHSDSAADALSEFVFKELSDRIPRLKNGPKTQLTSTDPKVLFIAMIAGYQVSIHEELELALAVADLAVPQANNLKQETLTPDIFERLRDAFDTKYLGDAHVKFYTYLARCWRRYREDATAFVAPYMALVQSSGSGKSRLLREVARMTKTDDPKTLSLLDEETQVSMRVLYVCTRTNKRSPGFPVATHKLTELFFGGPITQKHLTQQLLKAFSYVQSRWGEVGDEWFDLFIDPNTDVCAEIAIAATQTIRDDGIDCKQQNQLLVLVVDEARTLLSVVNEYGVSLFQLLRRALKDANDILKHRSYRRGIFAVLTDTNSKVQDFIPPKDDDEPSRAYEHNQEKIVFPPFVLTDTMDVLFKSLSGQLHQTIIEDNPDTQWATLVSMGRPL